MTAGTISAPTSAVAQTTFPDDLVQSLEKHNATFTTLLSLIPSQYYIALAPEEADSKWMKNKKRKTGEEIKEHKRRTKQEKLDPSNNLTTADILESNSRSSIPAVEAESSNAASQPLAGPSTIQPLPPQASISELRAKLQSKLDNFRRDRGVVDDAETDPASRDALEAARRQKRGEMRDRRRKERKEERRKARTEVTAKPAKTQLIVPHLASEPTDTLSYPSVSLPNKSGSKPRQSGPLKHLSNPAQALAHLEKHNAHLASLPEDKRKEIEDRERWAKAEQRAAGEKVADQEKVLKKAVKRAEKTKAKSSSQWADRKRDLEKSSQIAIKKRNDNIAKRAEDRRNKRLGIKDKGAKGGNKGGKKGGRPGFEGKKGKGKGKEKA